MYNEKDDIFSNKYDERLNDSYYNVPQKKNNKKTIFIVVAIVVAIVLSVGSFFIGYTYAKSTGLYGDMPLLLEAYSYVKQYYYEDIDWEEFQAIAAKSIVDNVDKFTGMYEYDYSTGSLALGVNISSDVYNRHTISYVKPSSPADTALAIKKYSDASLKVFEEIDPELEKVDIEIGDRIYAVSVNNLPPAKVENAASSYFMALVSQSNDVTLFVQKSNGLGEYYDGYYQFDITKKFVSNTKAYYYSSDKINDLSNNTAMIKLEDFTDTAAEDFLDCVNKFVEEGKTKLILDLRDNGGGDSQILGFISSCLLKGADASELNIAYYKFNKGRGKQGESFFTTQKTYEVKENDKTVKVINAVNLPKIVGEEFEITILCNGGSASCSEVIIGALSHYNNSLIVGSKTYGKGVAQTQIPLSDGKHYVLITNGKYYIPTKGENGETLWQTSIHETGFVPLTENKISTSTHRPYINDLYIARALQILND